MRSHFSFSKRGDFMIQDERRKALIEYLLSEYPENQREPIPEDPEEQRTFLRGLTNMREAKKCDPKFLKIQDDYLKRLQKSRGIVTLDKIPEIEPGYSIWQGDITTLECDAIVNAANSSLSGCFIPNHKCIDNAIHTYAGVQLRLRCADIMKKQGTPEPTGRAKITPAYNLPSKYVIHTVGPVIYESVSDKDKEFLASCYKSCLSRAALYDLKSIAFCCISTGVFKFPNELAAKIAIRTVKEFMKKDTSIERVIFNVFNDKDRYIYERLLRLS